MAQTRGFVRRRECPRHADLVLAVPAKDVLAITVELAALLARPALVVAIPDGWQGLADESSDAQDEASTETESEGPS